MAFANPVKQSPRNVAGSSFATLSGGFPATLALLLFLAAPQSGRAQVDGAVWANGQGYATESIPAPAPYGRPAPYGQPAYSPPLNTGAPPAVPRRTGGFSLPDQDSPDDAALRGQLAEALSQVRAMQRAEPENVEHRIREARYLSWLGRHYTAANRFRAVLREHPNHAEALTAYGNELYWQGNWREARAVYSQAIRLIKGNDITPRVGYIKTLAKSGRASEAYRRAMDLDRSTGRQDPELGMFIAESLGEIGMYAEGAGYARRPTNDRDILVRQAAFGAKQQLARTANRAAAGVVNRGLRQQGSYEAAVARGELLLRAKDFGAAGVAFQRATQIRPEREEGYLGLARLERNRGEYERALSGYRRAVQVNPESILGWIGIAEMSRFRKNPESAWQALETAHSIAPRSALVYREKLRLAHSQNDAERFEATLDEYRRAQPDDAHVVLWSERWAAHRKRPVNSDALRTVLDPMSPDVNAEALELLRRQGVSSWNEVSRAVPAAPSPLLDAPAREELNRRIRTVSPDVVNIRAGYEFSEVKDTTALDTNYEDWHELYLTGYWRRKHGNTFSFDYRNYHRFSENANEIQFGWSRHVSPRWVVGARAGGAFNGDFIPRWRLGLDAGFLQTDRLTWNLRYNHLNFRNEPVNQFVPGVTWQWNDRFASTARLYITHNAPENDVSNTGVSAYFDLIYTVAANSYAKVFVSFGDENATTLVQDLIGDKNFKSAGLELRLGINEEWAVIPGYRYESHNLFDLHAVSLALNRQF